ncbi:hypothetical protein ASPZODRAFT_129699 [Penicilliopsis zonata CBS 506.65]|uniref:Rhodopsin domain-containing protein n=1 Tax=Penicilliopsis zonata CBS 506.65 TaxID=1073090 RepID=A0A1L9SQA5_9EURO|nr:hypothetical protein ASPZODRAFT_129699 [Penicilliopsis zonata CBS 506.65]OJJ49273.1 hypothetical protein ASPZODRAFT_129699 [Penicilliopsis zonata CBS 506.65]
MSSAACYYAFGRHAKDVAKTGGNLVLGYKVGDTLSFCLINPYQALDGLLTVLQYFWFFQILYKIVLCLNKMSFLVFYLRIFPTKKFRLLCFATIAVVASGTFGFMIATIFQCVPVQANWHRHIAKKCVNNTIFRWCWAGYNTLMDMWVCLMPMPLLARLQLDTARKVGVMVVFGLGLFVCVTSMIRMRSMETSTTTTDPTWGSFDALMWSAIEASTGIICTCLPFLKGPIQNAFPRLFSSISQASRKSRSGGATYGMEKMEPKSTGHSGSASGTLWSIEGGNPKTEQWTRIENDAANQEGIGRNQILKKTDIEMHSDYISQ